MLRKVRKVIMLQTQLRHNTTGPPGRRRPFAPAPGPVAEHQDLSSALPGAVVAAAEDMITAATHVGAERTWHAGIFPAPGRESRTIKGRPLILGAYEASADSILYEMDQEYRKKVHRQRKDSQKSFGASLLRLRKQRRLRRGQFAPLSAKTIARIERNEIAKPRGRTLQIIADRLGVPPEEIGTY
jgi:hypothetical protein